MEPTHQTVDKPIYIKKLFNDISKTYDKANDFMTFGMARLWRKNLVKMSGAKDGMSILDCATGTGDLAIEFKKVVGPNGQVIGSDFCQGMLDYAPQKAKKQKLEITFEIADVMNLKYEDNSFNITSIAYGIRNIEDTLIGLKELARVTKSQGKVMILETGEPKIPVIKEGVQFYFKYIVPPLGKLISGNGEAYEYLNSSSTEFPCQQDFINLALQTDAFDSVTCKSLMGGASYIYTCVVK